MRVIQSPNIAALHAHLTANDTKRVLLVRGLPVALERDRDAIVQAVEQSFGGARTYARSCYGPGAAHALDQLSVSLVKHGLDWHTEDAFAPTPPTHVALLCLCGDPGVNTHVCPIAGPSPAQDVFGWVRPDPYLDTDGTPQRRPLAFASAGAIGWRYDPALIEADPACADQVPVLDEGAGWSLALETGDLLLLDNHRFAHARDAKKPTGQRRLLRMILG